MMASLKIGPDILQKKTEMVSRLKGGGSRTLPTWAHIKRRSTAVVL